MRLSALLLYFLTLLALSACGKPAERMLAAEKSSTGAMNSSGAPSAQQAHQSGETRRYIAQKHEMEVEFPAAGVQAAFDASLKRADELGAEVLDASISGATEYSQPLAHISLRLPPENVDKFLAGVEQGGNVLRHQREAEDKTDAVIDAEARIANLTELRDRLRRMLAERPAKFQDVIEIEKQLADTQASLDTISGIRKALAKQTDMVAVKIEFHAASSMPQHSAFAPLVNSWNQAGEVLMSSAGAVVTFIAAILPWLVVLIPAFWLIRKAWRGWRGRRNARAAGKARSAESGAVNDAKNLGTD